jgi:anti-anti-sigma regulatory factor
MTSSAEMKTLIISKKISTHLALRESANDMFEFINDLSSTPVVLDFSGVVFMSSSFAHQYILNKSKSRKEIVEINVPDTVDKMFALVKSRKPKTKNLTSKSSLEIVKAEF